MLTTVNGRLSSLGLLPEPTEYLDKADTQHLLTTRGPLSEGLLQVGSKNVLSVKMYVNGSLVEVPLKVNGTPVWEV